VGQIINFKVKSGGQANKGASDRSSSDKRAELQPAGGATTGSSSALVAACQVNIGGKLNPETGNVTGPTRRASAIAGSSELQPYSILHSSPADVRLTTYAIPTSSSFRSSTSSTVTRTRSR
jgi:hypothetical protein